MFELIFASEAQSQLRSLETSRALQKRYKAALKALAYLQTNPRHPGLNTHKYSAVKGRNGEEVFEAYAENKTLAPIVFSGITGQANPK